MFWFSKSQPRLTRASVSPLMSFPLECKEVDFKLLNKKRNESINIIQNYPWFMISRIKKKLSYFLITIL